MPQEYSQRQLEKMVTGSEENPNVQFYEQSTMNPDESKLAGKRVYHTRLMIKKTQPGLADFAAYAAQPRDIEEWPDEYQFFLNNKGDVGSPGIDIIPGLGMDVIQELRDYGLLTITKLCAAKTLPAHLQPAQASARRLNEVLQNEQSTNETKQTEEVPSADRRIDPTDVGRHDVPRSPGAEVSAIGAGPGQGGRFDGGEGRVGSEDQDGRTGCQEDQEEETGGQVKNPLVFSDNWSISIG